MNSDPSLEMALEGYRGLGATAFQAAIGLLCGVSSIPPFIMALRQPPRSLQRWLWIPVMAIGAALGIANSPKIPSPFHWIWAFKGMVEFIHSFSGLVIKEWELPKHLTMADSIRVGIKTWSNPRRIQVSAAELEKDGPMTQKQRAIFALKEIGLIALYVASLFLAELVKEGLLVTRPLYVAPFKRSIFYPGPFARLRSVFSVHWIFRTCLLLNISHEMMAIFFVSILQLDVPKEWPGLFSSPREAYTLQRFWGVFFHKIGSASLLEIGKAITARLNLKPTGAASKTFLAFFVFSVTGCIHVVAGWTTMAPDSPMEPLFWDMQCLMFSFVGGLLEFAVKGFFPRGERNSQGVKQPLPLKWRMLGYLWVFVFFYLIMPPYKYPFFTVTSAKARRPNFEVNFGN